MIGSEIALNGFIEDVCSSRSRLYTSRVKPEKSPIYLAPFAALCKSGASSLTISIDAVLNFEPRQQAWAAKMLIAARSGAGLRSQPAAPLRPVQGIKPFLRSPAGTGNNQTLLSRPNIVPTLRQPARQPPQPCQAAGAEQGTRPAGWMTPGDTLSLDWGRRQRPEFLPAGLRPADGKSDGGLSKTLVLGLLFVGWYGANIYFNM